MAATIASLHWATAFPVPPDVSTLTEIAAWGAGGGGGGAGTTNNAQGGGGGACSVITNYSVTPGSVIAVSIGTNGVGHATTGDGTAGGDTHFVDTSTLLAKGGLGGAGNVNTQPASTQGGQASAGVGTTKFSGGRGGASAGGGGGSAGRTGNGGNGGDGPPSGAAGTAGSGGGAAGGAGGPNASAGLNGEWPGGGGGGGDASGGDGGDGEDGGIEVSLTTDYPVIGGLTRVGGINSTTATYQKPPGTVSGDLLICHITSGSAGQFTAPADAVAWTEHTDVLYNVSGERVGLFYKIAGGSEPSSYTFTAGNTGGLSGNMVRIPAGTFDPVAPINVVASADLAATTTPDSPSATTTVDKCTILLFLSVADNDPNATAPTGTAYMGEISAAGGGAGSDIMAALAWTYKATAGATGAYEWTISISNASHAMTVAIAPKIVFQVGVDSSTVRVTGQTVPQTQVSPITKGDVRLTGQSVTLTNPQDVDVTPQTLRLTGQAVVQAREDNVIPQTLRLTGQTVALASEDNVAPQTLRVIGQTLLAYLSSPVAPAMLQLTGQTVPQVFPQAEPVSIVTLALAGQTIVLDLREAVAIGQVVVAGQEVDPVSMEPPTGTGVDTSVVQVVGQTVPMDHRWIGAAARRNLFTYSEEFDNAAWTKQFVTATPNTDIAPDGTLTADTLTDIGIVGDLLYRDAAVPDDTAAYAWSLYVKKTVGDPNFCAMQSVFTGGTTVSCGVVLNTNTGVISSTFAFGSTILSSGVEDVGDYWRVFLVVPNNGLGNTVARSAFWPAWNTTGTTSVDTALLGSKVIWGAQFEIGALTAYQKIVSGTADEWVVPLSTLTLSAQGVVPNFAQIVEHGELQLTGQMVPQLTPQAAGVDATTLQLIGQTVPIRLSVPVAQAGLVLAMGTVDAIYAQIEAPEPATLVITGQTLTIDFDLTPTQTQLLITGQVVTLDRGVTISPANLRVLSQALGFHQNAIIHPASLILTGRLVAAGAEFEPIFGRGNALLLTARGDAFLLEARGDAFLLEARGDCVLSLRQDEMV